MRLTEYIFEAKSTEIAAGAIVKMLEGTNLTSEQATLMLTNLSKHDARVLKRLSEVLEAEDAQAYLPYMPGDDELTNASKVEAACKKIGEYLSKTICKR